MAESYTTTADYEHLDVALKSFWNPFNELLNEMDSFVPRPLSDFDDRRKRSSEHILKLNPNMSDEQVNELVEREIKASTTTERQFSARFSERFMTMYVTVTLLSQALCEAEINAILATGLYEHGLADRFAKIQMAGIKEKWLKSPKIFCPEYELKKDSALCETLNHLIEQRNTWMHHKIHLHAGEVKIIEGSKLQRSSYKEGASWMKRFFSLPYDLAAHAHAQTQQMHAAIIVFKRTPIPTADAHK